MKAKRQRLKKLLLILSGVLAVFVMGAVFLTLTLKKRVEQQLTHLFPGQQVRLSSIQPDLLRSSLSINGLFISLKADSSLPSHQHTLYFPKVELTGINVFKLISEKNLYINKVKIENSKIKLDELLLNNNEFSIAHQLSNVQMPFRQLFVKDVEIEKANVCLHSKNSNHLLLRGNIAFHELNVNGLDKSFNTDNAHLASFDCRLYDVNYPLTNSNQALHIKDIIADSHQGVIRIDSLNINFSLDRSILVEKANHAAAQIRATISKIELKKPALMGGVHKKIAADEISFWGSTIELSNAKSRISNSNNKALLADYFDKILLEIRTEKLAFYQTSFIGDHSGNHLRVRGDVVIRQLQVHPIKPPNKATFDFSTIDFSLADFYSSIPHTSYNISINHVKMNGEKDVLSLNGLKLIPQLGKFEFSRKLGYQADRIEATVSQIVVNHPNIIQLLNHNLFTDAVVLDGCNARIFRDRRLPRKMKFQPLPIAFLKKLPWNIRINRLQVKNSAVIYDEYPKEGQQSGEIAIMNLQLSLSPLLNHPNRTDPSQLLLKTTGAIMHSGVVSATIYLPLYSDNYVARGAIENLSLTSLNASSENLGQIKIKSGLLDSLGFAFDFTDKKATGKIVGVYHNLIIQPLKKGGENGKRKVSKLKSFVLRHFIIPLNKDRSVPIAKRTGEINYQRDPTRFISYYILQALLTGIKSSFALGFLLPK